MSDIEVSTALRRARLVGNGTAGPFAFTFEINNQSDIKVYVDSTLKTLTTHYTVTINTNGTGSVSFTTGNHPTNSQKVTIVSDVPVSRTSVYTSGGNITAASLESDFDKHTMMIGDQKERTLRALSAPVYDPLDVTLVLPDASTRASKFLSFDLAGNITVSGLNSINALTLSDLTVTNPIFTVNGTTGAPAIAPTSNADTGVAFINGSGVQIIVDGSIAGNFGASSSSVGILSVANGSQATPGLSFTGGTDTGLYHANGKMYVSHDNNETIEITNAVTKINSNTVNLGPSVAVIGNNMQGISTLTATNANISSTLTVDDVTFSGVTAGATWNRGTNRFILNNNAAIAFGTSQNVLFTFDGSNLQITGGNINHVGNFETDQLALTTATNTTTVTKILNDDSMSGNDASALVTQQSVKQYVDTQVARFDSLEEILANSASTGTYTLLVDTGEIKFNDNRYLTLGSDNDFRARHNSGTTTFTGDVTFDGNLKFQNNHALAFGDSSPLYIYSDGTTSFIKENGSGDLRIQASVLDIKNVAGTNSIAKFTQNAGADLFYGSNRRLHTTNAGAVVTGNLQVTGNVTIDGSSTTVNSTTVTVDDPIFTLGGDTAPSSDDNKDRGIEFRWHNGSAAKVGFFGFDDSTGKFTFIPDATNSSEVFSGSTGTITAALEGNADTASFMSGLSDPGADRLVMWDESANAHAFVSIGSGLSLSGTTLTGNASANDATITLSAGTALSGGGDFTTDQSSNETITFNLNHLGLESLADPNADRIVFWDDSAGSMQFLTVGSNLTLSGTTLSGTSAANDATINLIAGTAISGGGNFTTDQSAAESITFNLNHLGLESLADPDDDRIFFWDDSAGAAQWLDLGTNLAISGTTLNATDTNTQYTAGTGLSLSSTEFSIDTAVVPQLAGNSTFTGANTFSGNNTFSGVTDFTADLEISSGNKINLNSVLHIDSGGTIATTGSNYLYMKSFDVRIGDEAGRIAFRSYDLGSNLTAALSYNSSEKLRTISSGILVNGLITVSGTVDGRDVAADGTKLDGIASGAQVNQNAFTTVAVSGQNNIVADAASDTLTLAAGSNVTITTADSTDTVTFAATNTTYSAGSGIGLSGTAFSVAAGTGLSQTTSGLALSHLGLESLSDPNDDRIIFWDDSAGATAFLDIGTGLSISGTTLNATTDLSSYATQSYVSTQINNLIDSAPGAMNTLNELAAALGDDANFSTTVTNSIATKLPLAGGTLTAPLTIDTNTSGILRLSAANGSPWAIDLQRDDVTNSRVYNAGGFWSFEHEPRYYNSGSHQKIFHDGYHPNADKWTTSRTLSLTGDVTGSVSWDGSGNASLAATVANDSHTHAYNNLTGKGSGTGNYITTGQYRWGTGSGTFSGNPRSAVIGYSGGNYGQIGYGWHPTGTSGVHTSQIADLQSRIDLYNGIIVYGSGSSQSVGSTVSWTELLDCRTNAFQYKNNNIFHDGYHPNADTLTTARTINGVSFNGSANITVADSTKLPLAGGTMTGELQLNARLDVGSGTQADAEIRVYKGDNNVSDHIQFYNGTTRVGEIGCEDTSWLRINQETAKNIYTPRYIRADGGFFVDSTAKGINGSGNFIGGTITGASDANVSNWNTAYTTANAALPKAGGTMTGHVSFNDGYSINRVEDIWLDGKLGHYGDSDTWFRFHGSNQCEITCANAQIATFYSSGGGSGGIITFSNLNYFQVNSDIRATGNITAYYSDERLKTKTGKIENALDKVSSLEGFYYVENDLAKSCGFDNEQTQVALSAQQVQAVMPECVSLAPFDIAGREDFETDEKLEPKSKSGENYLTVDYAKLVPLLIEAVKEQQDQIETLKSRLTKLES